MWRYKVEVFDVEANGPKALDGLLAALGQDKWELVTVTPAFGQLLLVFKKPAA